MNVSSFRVARIHGEAAKRTRSAAQAVRIFRELGRSEYAECVQSNASWLDTARGHARMAVRLGLAAALAAGLSGCTTRTLTLPGGASYRSKRFGNVEKLGVVELRQGTNTFRIEGYSGDQVTLAREVTEAAVSAAIKGVTP